MTTRQNSVVLLAFVLALLLPALAMADPPSVVGRLNLAEGAVSFRPGSLDEWAPAVLNYPLTAGDHLWTDEAGGRAEFHVGSTAVRLYAGTEISFLNLDDQTVQLGISQGEMNVRLRRLDPGDAFEIDTPNSVFTLQQAGSYSVSVQGDEGSSLTVWSGQADVTAGGDELTVPPGQTGTVSGSGSIAWYLQPATRDAADAWYSARDAREDQLVSARYAPREMIGVEDLDENGSWSVIAGYGAAWAPARVPVGWAPYKYGHWAWVAPWGWTWIDDAPWGFAPFHYGRWAFVNGRWFWIPGDVVQRPVYAPALVVFVGGGPGERPDEGIGWFPLGPREVYVPPYGASTTYVQRINVTNVSNINVVNIERYDVTQVTYVNRTVPAAVTVVPRQSFGQGRPASAGAMTFSSEQARRAPILGMGATVPPQRESIIGQPLVARNPAPQPPPRVAGRSVFGRIVPAPAPAPFTFRADPLPPVTVYQRPAPRVAPSPSGPVRQKAPILINPMISTQGQQAPQRVIAQPQQGSVSQAPPQRQPAPIVQPAQPVQPAPNMQPARPVQPAPIVQPAQPQRVVPQNAPPPSRQRPVLQPAQPQMQPPQPQPQPQPKQQPQPQLQPQPQPQSRPQPQQPPRMAAPPVQGGPIVQKPQGGGGDHGQAGQPENNKAGAARNLISALKQSSLPGTQGRLESARKNPKVKLDYAALSRRLEAARSAIAAAESTLSAGKSDAALQQAQAAQGQLAELDRLIEDAVKSSAAESGDHRSEH